MVNIQWILLEGKDYFQRFCLWCALMYCIPTFQSAVERWSIRWWPHKIVSLGVVSVVITSSIAHYRCVCSDVAAGESRPMSCSCVLTFDKRFKNKHRRGLYDKDVKKNGDGSMASP